MNPLDLLFAALYDRILAPSEVRGLARWRADLLADVSGDVLELGAGTGLNLPHYPAGVRPVLVEPSAEMRAKLAARAGNLTVIDARAEALPFADASFDAVVVGLVLCSVDDLTASLAEIRRVLRPGGRLVFIEHVASHEPCVRRTQALVQPVWGFCGRGCRLTRDTERAIADAGFAFASLDRSGMPGGFFLIRSAIHGVAVRGASDQLS